MGQEGTLITDTIFRMVGLTHTYMNKVLKLCGHLYVYKHVYREALNSVRTLK